jgi:hypothetical protein
VNIVTAAKMEEFGFYYTIQSNASKKMFPDNKPSRFRVCLPSNIDLDDRWVVGLSEIHFPLSFKGISSGNEINIDNSKPAKRKRATPAEPVIYERSSELEIQIDGDEIGDDHTLYRTGGGGGESGNSAFEKTFNPDQLLGLVGHTSNSEVGRLLFQHQKEYQEWKKNNTALLDKCEDDRKSELQRCNARIEKLTDENLKMLGAKQFELTKLKGELEAHKSAVEYWKDNFVSLAQLAYRDANQMNNFKVPKYLYIYCDIVKMRYLGDTFANFLHVARVPPIRINGDTACDRFDFPKYNKLCSFNFDQIGIVIRDEKGQEVTFDDGIVIITLHFKRVRC